MPSHSIKVSRICAEASRRLLERGWARAQIGEVASSLCNMEFWRSRQRRPNGFHVRKLHAITT